MNITLTELEVFLAVVDTGSLTAAAQQLDQPISSVSRSLARLEDKLSTPLLRRTTRRLDLTDEGCSFLTDARAILQSVTQAEERLRSRNGAPSGPLRVDAATPFLLHVLLPLIGGYRARYPLVELELSSNDGFVDLLERRIDLAIRIGEMKDSTLHSRLLGRTALRIVASPGYLRTHGMPTTVADLEHHSLLGFSDPQSLNTWPLLARDGRPLHVHPTLRAANGEVLRQLALADQGITCLSAFMTDADIAQGALVEVLSEQNTGMSRPVQAVYYRNTTESARIVSFVDHLQAALQTRDGVL